MPSKRKNVTKKAKFCFLSCPNFGSEYASRSEGREVYDL